MKHHLHKLLDYIQRHTKTDSRYLAKGGFWLMVSYGVQVGFGIITTIVLANVLTKDTLGTYQYVLATAGILSVFTLSGLGQAITRGVARGNDGLLRSGVRAKLKWSVGIVLASATVAGYYFIQGNLELGLAFLVVGACAPFIESFRLFESFLFGKEAFRDSVLLGAWRKPLPLVTIITTAYFYPEPLALITAYFLSNALSLTLVYWRVLKKYQPPDEDDAETLHYSKHLTVLRMLSVTANHADKVLVWHFLGPAAVATFTIAQFATRYSGGLLNTVSALALPRLSKRDLPTLQKTLPRKVLLFTGFMALGTAVYIALAPLVFTLVFPEYTDAALLSQALALGFLFVPRGVYGKALTAHMRTKEQYVLGIAQPVMKLGLLATLIPLFQLWGAVAATLLAGLFGAVVAYTLFKQVSVTAESAAVEQ